MFFLSIHHHISQAGWNRCNLSIYLLGIDTCIQLCKAGQMYNCDFTSCLSVPYAQLAGQLRRNANASGTLMVGVKSADISTCFALLAAVAAVMFASCMQARLLGLPKTAEFF